MRSNVEESANEAGSWAFFYIWNELIPNDGDPAASHCTRAIEKHPHGFIKYIIK